MIRLRIARPSQGLRTVLRAIRDLAAVVTLGAVTFVCYVVTESLTAGDHYDAALTMGGFTFVFGGLTLMAVGMAIVYRAADKLK